MISLPVHRLRAVLAIPAVAALALAAVIVLSAPGAGAQSPVLGIAPGSPPDADTVIDPASPAQISALVTLLGDPGVRAWLTDQAEAEARAASASGAGTPSSRAEGALIATIAEVRGRLAALRGSAQALPAELARARTILSLELEGRQILAPILAAVLLLSVGLVCETGYRWRVGPGLVRRIEAAQQAGLPSQAAWARTAVRIVGLLVFTLTTLIGFFTLSWSPIVELLTLSMILAVLITRAVAVISGLVLAPHRPSLRLARIGDRTARRLHRWVVTLAALGAAGFLVLGAVRDLGLLPQSLPLLYRGLATALAVLAGAMALDLAGRWHVRDTGAARSARGPGSPAAPPAGRRTPAERLGVPAVLLWIILLWLLAMAGLIGPLAVLMGITVAAAADTALCPIMRQLTGRPAPDGTVAASAYLPIWIRLMRLTVAVVIAVPVLRVLGVDVLTGQGGGMLETPFVSAAFEVAVTLLVADLVWQAVRIAIERRLAKGRDGEMAAATASVGGEGGGGLGADSRAQTLLPLFEKFIAGVLVVMVTMIVLSSLGVDIGPLLAGAGVVGIAIGFGAQTLVRDIVSGIFFLIDDAFRVGEYIESGELRGTVEGITLRSLKLRHHRGQIHTVPFGELRSLTTYSRDWVIMKLEFRVPFDTDLALVKKIVKQIGRELEADPDLGPGFLEPLKSQGVRRMEEFNMVVGVKFMAKPGAQWLIRREAYQRIRDAFEANGISFARRDVTVNVRRNASADEEQQAVTAATQIATDTGPVAGAGG